MNGDNPALTWKIDLRDLPRMMVQGKEQEREKEKGFI